MVLTRYTFGGTGIFHALPLLEESGILELQDEMDLVDAEAIFDQKLPIPALFAENKFAGNTLVSFFTPKGLKEFSEQIEILKSMFSVAEYAGLGKLKKISLDSKKLHIVYQDDFQVVGIHRL